MDADRFDSLARSLAFMAGATRRGILGGIAALGLGPLLPRVVEAKQKRKKHKKPLVFNTYGCINVGAKCRGRADLCCSGICAGKNPKKGQKDNRRCVAHDTGGCLVGQGYCFGGVYGSCTTSVGSPGACETTTGNALYCAYSLNCFPCSKDEECVPACGPLAACIVCESACPATGGRHCAGPGECDF